MTCTCAPSAQHQALGLATGNAGISGQVCRIAVFGRSSVIRHKHNMTGNKIVIDRK
jgi:hypothetical protein